jgi:uncharacterized membrane protein HdeD (DUF308 family)
MPPKRKVPEAEPSYFSKRNWQWLGAGAIVIIAGFITLSQGSITIAPILLVLGYCVLIPIGILAGPKRVKDQGSSGDSAPN